MIAYLERQDGGYQDRIKIENNRFLMIINVTWWFPDTKARLNKLLKIMYENDCDYSLGLVLSSLIISLRQFQKEEYVNPKMKEKLERNIDQIKVFNGLYGGN